MDVNIVAALISLAGSAGFATFGALVRWHRKRNSAKALDQEIAELRNHPALAFVGETTLHIECCDDTKSDLLNAIKDAVLLRPVEEALAGILENLSTIHKQNLTIGDVEVFTSRALDFLQREQNVRLSEFPEQTHAVTRRLLEAHSTALLPISDLCTSDMKPVQLLNTIFHTFYIATFSAAIQWGQTANQLNGQLNGLIWKSKKLQYSFQGNVSDASRIISETLAGIHFLIGLDCLATILDSTGRIESVSPGIRELFGYRPQELIGKPLSVLQLGLEDVPDHENLRLLETGETTCLECEIRTTSGLPIEIIGYGDGLILHTPLTRNCRLILLHTKSQSRAPTSQSANESPDAEDIHTRFALLMSSLAHPTRRVITGSHYHSRNDIMLVHVVVDGAPDVPQMEVGKSLHAQMNLPARRIAEVCERSRRRLQNDLLRVATLRYIWRSSSLMAEFYLIGKEDNLGVFSIHRPLPDKDTSANESQLKLTASSELRKTKAPCFPKILCAQKNELGKQIS